MESGGHAASGPWNLPPGVGVYEDRSLRCPESLIPTDSLADVQEIEQACWRAGDYYYDVKKSNNAKGPAILNDFSWLLGGAPTADPLISS